MNILDSAANDIIANIGLERMGARTQSCLTPYEAEMRSDEVLFITVRPVMSS